MLEINKKKLVPGIVATWGDITGNVENQKDLVEYIDNHTSEAVWGGITGDIADQEDLQEELSGKQDTLVSGVNIKTVNDQSLLGSGNITIEGGGEDNVIEIVKVNGTALTPDVNKAVDVIVPTKTSDLTNDSGYLTENNFKTINNESIVGSGNIEVGGLTPEQEDAIDVIINAGDGYLKHTPEVHIIGAREAIMTLNDEEGFRQQNLHTLNGDVYLHNPVNSRLYKFNRQTYQFEEGPQTTASAQNEHLWADSQGRVYADNYYLVNLETGEYTYKDMGGDFQIHTGSNLTNIIEKDGVVYMISYNNSCAYIFNEETQEFDSSIPVQGTFPESNFYRYFTEFEGHWIYDAGSTQTELVFHLDVAEPYAEWVALENRLFPGAWTYEYEGRTINETTRGVFVHYVTINGVKEYYNWGYRNPVMYKLINGAWEIVPFTMNVDGYRSQASGASIDDLWFGYGYVSGSGGIIMWNLGEAKGIPESYTWEQIDLSGYATQEWVSGQGYAYGWQLDSYVYDPNHHLTLTGNTPLVDGKQIANIDMCFVNDVILPYGPDFNYLTYNPLGEYTTYWSWFVNRDGELYGLEEGNKSHYYKWNDTQQYWEDGNWSVSIEPTNIIKTTQHWYYFENLGSTVAAAYRIDNSGTPTAYSLADLDTSIYGDYSVWPCGDTIRNGSDWKFDTSNGWVSDPIPQYISGKYIVFNSKVYVVSDNENMLYEYDETTKTYTAQGACYQGFLFVSGNKLYVNPQNQMGYIFEVDLSRANPSDPYSADLMVQTDIFYTNPWTFYGESNGKLYTFNTFSNNDLGTCTSTSKSVPAVPVQDGTYVLKATVLNGQVTYSWVVDEVAQAVQITNEILG